MTKQVNLRIPDDVHEDAVAAAEADDRSLNSWCVAVLRRAGRDARKDSTKQQQRRRRTA